MARRKREVVGEVSMETGELFEVKRNGVTLASTIYPACYPTKERRDELRKAGYKLYLGGKVYKEKKEP